MPTYPHIYICLIALQAAASQSNVFFFFFFVTASYKTYEQYKITINIIPDCISWCKLVVVRNWPICQNHVLEKHVFMRFQFLYPTERPPNFKPSAISNIYSLKPQPYMHFGIGIFVSSLSSASGAKFFQSLKISHRDSIGVDWIRKGFYLTCLRQRSDCEICFIKKKILLSFWHEYVPSACTTRDA